MTALRIALIELHRLTSSRMRRLSVLALVLIPTLYGGLYLYANRDPYQNLGKLPAALVVEDAGAATTDGEALNAGRDVAKDLLASGSFDWSPVDAGRAATGVREGTYAFALTIPRGFSAALTSSQRFDPRQARLTLTTNDANSYISTTIADNLVDQVKDTLAAQVGTDAAANFLLGISRERASLVRAADGSTRLTGGLIDASAGARKLAAGATGLEAGSGRLQDGAATLTSGLRVLEDRTALLPPKTAALADGARRVADGADRLAATGRGLAAAVTSLAERYGEGRDRLDAALADAGLTPEQRQRVLAAYDAVAPAIKDGASQVTRASTSLDQLAAGAEQVADGNAALAAGTAQLVDGVRRAGDGAARLAAGTRQLSQGLDQVAGGATDLTTGMDRLSAGSARLSDGLQAGITKLPDLDAPARDRLAETIGEPVAVQSSSHGTWTYGAGLAPFFLTLATWIGGYVLFLLARPLSERALAANQSPWRVTLGGWLTPALVGLLQVAVLFGLVVLTLGIVPAEPIAALGFIALTSVTFMAIVHWLNAWLGAVGQFFGLVLMVVQLVSAGGTFPWQTIPEPLQRIHHVLPMPYAVDGLRQLMFGGLGSLVLRDVLVLGAYLVGALLLTAAVAHRRRMWSANRIKPELVI